MTPLSASSPYCDATAFLIHHDWRAVADLVHDGQGAKPTKSDVLGNDVVAAKLLAASGEVESACVAGNRYSPTDLAGLTGAGLALLEQLTANLAFWRLQQRRQPVSADPQRVPGAVQALQMLEYLRSGERIFPTEEAADAGLPEAVDTVRNNQTNRQRRVVATARRLFGIRSGDCP